MKIVIQCAATKASDAGYLRTPDGRQLMFVARPELAPRDQDCLYVRPDDPWGNGRASWRELLVDYNRAESTNPDELFPAYRLYSHPVYQRLVDTFGLKSVYILSAGWGLIRSTFLTPQYDITFSNAPNVAPYKKRKKRVQYNDFCQLPAGSTDTIVFLGGKDYVSLFCKLTESMNTLKIIFYNSDKLPDAPRCELYRYETTCRTNWHYLCAADLSQGLLLD